VGRGDPLKKKNVVAYEPSLEDIQKEAEEIRLSWTNRQRKMREAIHSPKFEDAMPAHVCVRRETYRE
jgi:hypothetical protein